MRLVEVYAKIKALSLPIFQTRQVAVLLDIKNATASKILGRLERYGAIIHLRSGIWGIVDNIDPMMLPEYLTAPFPSYISLQSALYYHGLITQIPEIIYAVSISRARKFITPLGVISIHHIQPEYFFGFIAAGKRRIKMATAEKALFDILYFTTTKTKLFTSLPELEFPKQFSIKKLEGMLNRVKAKNRKTLMTTRLDAILSSS